MPEFESTNETSPNAEAHIPEAPQANAQNEAQAQPQRSSNLRSRLRKAGQANEPKGGLASSQVGEIDPASVRESLGLSQQTTRSEAPAATEEAPQACNLEDSNASDTPRHACSENRRPRPSHSGQSELNLDNEPSQSTENRYGSSNNRGPSGRGEREAGFQRDRQEYRPSRGNYSNDRPERNDRHDRQDRPVRAGSTQAAARLQSLGHGASNAKKAPQGLWASIKSFFLGLVGTKPKSSSSTAVSPSREHQHGSWNSQPRSHADRDRRGGGHRRGGHSSRGGRGGRGSDRGERGGERGSDRSRTPR